MHVENNHTIEQLTDILNSRKHLKIREKVFVIKMAKEGFSNHVIAKHFQRSSRSILNWVNVYNKFGLEGFSQKTVGGSKPKLSEEEIISLKQKIIEGPDKEDLKTSFNGEDIQALVKEQYGKEYSLSGVYKFLKKIGLSYTKPRPTHPKSCEKVRKKWVEEDLVFF